MPLQFLKDILFPVYCVGCEREGEWCCRDCFLKIEPRAVQECPVCYRENSGEACGGCKADSFLEGTLALYRYKEHTPLGRLIKQLKYQHARETIKIFRELIFRARYIFNPHFESEKEIALIPIPLHERRKRERGFNQAELLAKLILKVWKEQEEVNGVQLDKNSLVRTRYTEQQATLSHDERVSNLKSAFKWQGTAVPERVVLIDDVFTTGSTLQAAAQALKQAGVQRVWGLTLARGKMS